MTQWIVSSAVLILAVVLLRALFLWFKKDFLLRVLMVNC